ncbi:FAD/NAD(P)-binding protein [Nocardioides insulae]|uniref:FAD/NAD(P)-binding protein n=1 Tax=Nocardioides insulae TaxID=394734 RepID=UPI0003F89A0C|nr:FAD/NAD(P)-binding protein [Nocardioides insulae]
MRDCAPGECPRVVVAGGGAAGTLTALHLARAARRRSTRLEVLLLDPADRWARGVAFGTTDEDHLLNVPASGMSALPEEPGHFVAWLGRQEVGSNADANAFVARRQFARYLDDTLTQELQADALVTLRHLRTRAVGVLRTGSGWTALTSEGARLAAEAIVVATGLPGAGDSWAAESLRDSAFFVPDPWATGALDVVRRDAAGPSDVLIVGAGLTMVDVVLSLSAGDNRPDRTLHAVSRTGRLPRAHLAVPKLAAIPDISDWGGTLEEILPRAERHLHDVRATTGDWRPAVDGLRYRIAELWERLDDGERDRFVAEHAGGWNTLRHRMPPTSATLVDSLRSTGRLRVEALTVGDAEPLQRGGVRVSLSDGSRRDVGWVVNCTGPRADIRTLGNPLLDDLLRSRPGGAIASVASAGMGFSTDRGRLIGGLGDTEAPIWTLGALRRGELWESTAVPEIRVQASGVATSILDAVAPLPRRLEDGRWVGGHHPVARPRDPLGLPLSTTAEAAAAYNAGLERVMRLQSGGEDLIREATRLDPDFAVAHAALALLGHEAGADIDVGASLGDARASILTRGDAREASFVEVVGRRVEDLGETGAQALMSHVATHPRDALAVSAAVPTIAFSGVTDVRREAWDLVEGLAPAYGDHWWYISLLAFTRQDQGRFEEAGMLAESALSCEPTSGHAVHAQTHVFYETGQHEEGRAWLDHWVRESGRSASHRAHFSWHAALHELALGDTEAVRHRYYSQLAPDTVTGVRALVDSASLLWRWHLTTSGWDAAAAAMGAAPAFAGEGPTPPIGPILAAADPALLERPETPFVALHAAIARTAAGDAEGLRRLGVHALGAADPTLRSVVAPVCRAFGSLLEKDWRGAAERLQELLPVLPRVGGSDAQREVVEEAMLYGFVHAGDAEAASAVLSERLERRDSPLDARRAHALASRVSASPITLGSE